MSVHTLIILGSFLCGYAFKTLPVDKVADTRITLRADDSLNATKSITGFLRWYKTNMQKVNRFTLLPKNKKGYYVVDEKACAGYLAFLKSSGFVAPKYIGYWQRYFHDKAVSIAKEKLRSDIPEGFDMDLVLLTQEPDLVVKEIDKLQFTVVSINKEAAVMGMKVPADSSIQYEFEMYKRGKAWQIGYISTPNYD